MVTMRLTAAQKSNAHCCANPGHVDAGEMDGTRSCSTCGERFVSDPGAGWHLDAPAPQTNRIDKTLEEVETRLGLQKDPS